MVDENGFVKCDFCGATLPPKVTLCPFCGGDLSTVEAAPPAPQVVEEESSEVATVKTATLDNLGFQHDVYGSVTATAEKVAPGTCDLQRSAYGSEVATVETATQPAPIIVAAEANSTPAPVTSEEVAPHVNTAAIVQPVVSTGENVDAPVYEGEETFSCPKCGNLVKHNMQFCVYCGVRLKEEEKATHVDTEPLTVCPRCKQPVKPNMKYCTTCGLKLDAPEASTNLPESGTVVITPSKNTQEDNIIDQHYDESTDNKTAGGGSGCSGCGCLLLVFLFLLIALRM